MSEPMHIMHVVLSLDVGGLERVVLSLIREGVRMGQRVSVVCVERAGKLAGEAEEAGAGVWCAGKLPGVKFKTIETIRAHMVELRPDVVHTHQIGALFYAGPAARKAGVRVVVHTEHGKHYEKNRRRRWVGWWAGRYAQRFFCVSKDIAAAVVRRGVVAEGKVRVVHNGIDTDKFAHLGDGAALREELGIPREAAVVGTVGRLAEVKRQEVLIRGVAAAKGGRTGIAACGAGGVGAAGGEVAGVGV